MCEFGSVFWRLASNEKLCAGVGTFLLSRCRSVGVGSPREVKSAASGKAELALPTLAIAEVPVAELPVRDRLLLWENSQLVKFRIEHEATLKSEDTNDAAQPAATDPYSGGVFRSVGYAHMRV